MQSKPDSHQSCVYWKLREKSLCNVLFQRAEAVRIMRVCDVAKSSPALALSTRTTPVILISIVVSTCTACANYSCSVVLFVNSVTGYSCDCHFS